jgi:hypothetical protein
VRSWAAGVCTLGVADVEMSVTVTVLSPHTAGDDQQGEEREREAEPSHTRDPTTIPQRPQLPGPGESCPGLRQ